MAAGLSFLSPVAAQDATPKKGGEFVYYDYLAVSSFQLQNAILYQNSGVINQIVDRLVYRDPKTSEFSPWLATSWEINDAKTEYTFHLRDGVTFSDGSPFDADVLKVNLDILAKGDKDKGVPRNVVFPSYDRAEIIDPKTVRVFLKKTDASFLDTLSEYRAGIVSKATYALSLEEQAKPANLVGSGPFVVESHVRGKEIVLKRREGYAWAPAPAANQGEAYLDRVRVVAVPEDSVRVGALIAGQADGVRNVPSIDEQRVKDSGSQFWAAPLPGIVQQLTVHPGYKYLGDIKVRKAVQFAINRQELVATVLSPTYPVATSVLDSTVPGYVDLSNLLPYDPEASNRLLDEAGWTREGDGVRSKDGNELVLEVYVAPYFLQSKQLLELVAVYLSNVGIKLNIKSTDIGSYAAYSETSETSFVQTVRARGTADMLYNFFHSEAGGLLHSPVPELDTILAGFAFAADDKVRSAGILEAQRYLIEQAYSIPLHEERQTFGLAKHVRGFSTETLARPWFYQVWLDK